METIGDFVGSHDYTSIGLTPSFREKGWPRNGKMPLMMTSLKTPTPPPTTTTVWDASQNGWRVGEKEFVKFNGFDLEL
jgi:hypothetical protein